MSWIGRETPFIERLPFFPEMTVYLIGQNTNVILGYYDRPLII